MADPAMARMSRVMNLVHTDDHDDLDEETSGSVAEAVVLVGRSRVTATVVVVVSEEPWFGSGVLVVVVVGAACGVLVVVLVVVVVGMSSSNTAEEASDMLVLEAVDVGDKVGVVVVVVVVLGAAACLVVVIVAVLLDVLGVLVVKAGDTVVVVPPVFVLVEEARGVTTAGMELVRSWRFRPNMRRNERVDWTDWASPVLDNRPPPNRVEVALRRTLAFPFPELLRQDDRNRWANRKRRLRTEAVVEVVKVLASSAKEEDEGSSNNGVELRPAPVVCCKRLTNLAVRRWGTFQVS